MRGLALSRINVRRRVRCSRSRGNPAVALHALQQLARFVSYVCICTIACGGCGQSSQIHQRSLVTIRKGFEPYADVVPAEFSPDSKRLGTSVGQVILYNLDDLKDPQEIILASQHVGRIAFSPAGSLIAVVCSNQNNGPDEITLVDLKSLRTAATLRAHSGAINALAFSPDGKSLVTCGSTLLTARGWNRGELRLWDVDTGRVKATVDSADHTFACVAYSRSGKTFFSGGGRSMNGVSTGEIASYDSTTCKRRRTRSWDGGIVQSVVAFPGDQICASGSADGYVRLWDAVSLEDVYSYDTTAHSPRRCGIWSVAVSQDGAIMGVGLGYWVRGGGWGELHLMDVRTKSWRKALIRNYPRPVTSVAFSSDGRLVAAAGGDGAIWSWSVAAVSGDD